MSFEDLWEDIWKHSGLPDMAKDQIPKCLSEKTKHMIVESELGTEELGTLFYDAVEKIDQGSIDSLEDLVLRGLK